MSVNNFPLTPLDIHYSHVESDAEVILSILTLNKKCICCVCVLGEGDVFMQPTVLFVLFAGHCFNLSVNGVTTEKVRIEQKSLHM